MAMNLPSARIPTTLTAFGKPSVALVPAEVTSVRWLTFEKKEGTALAWGDELWIGCGGIEMKVGFENPGHDKACFD